MHAKMITPMTVYYTMDRQLERVAVPFCAFLFKGDGRLDLVCGVC